MFFYFFIIEANLILFARVPINSFSYRFGKFVERTKKVFGKQNTN